MSTVAIVRNGEKRELLDQVIEVSGFLAHLRAAAEEQGVERAEFRIAIKPNLMIFQNREVPEVATDPDLLKHLAHRLREDGFTKIALVESQNTMGNWNKNRSVRNVARVAGYPDESYEIVDLTLEREPHVYRVRGLPAWNHFVGRTWRDAHYRIDFAKLKTQLDNNYTLSLKNQFGVLPLRNKYWHYHTRRPYWACTLYTLVNFPVHFGFIDGYTASDGPLGFAVQYNPKQPEILMAGPDIIALDFVGATLMSLDPMDSPLARFTARHFGMPTIEIVGDDAPVQGWENVPETLHNVVDIGQAIYVLSNVGAASGILNIDTKEFPPRLALMRWWYAIMNQVMLWFSGRRLNAEHRKALRGPKDVALHACRMSGN